MKTVRSTAGLTLWSDMFSGLKQHHQFLATFFSALGRYGGTVLFSASSEVRANLLNEKRNHLKLKQISTLLLKIKKIFDKKKLFLVLYASVTRKKCKISDRLKKFYWEEQRFWCNVSHSNLSFFLTVMA